MLLASLVYTQPFDMVGHMAESPTKSILWTAILMPMSQLTLPQYSRSSPMQSSSTSLFPSEAAGFEGAGVNALPAALARDTLCSPAVAAVSAGECEALAGSWVQCTCACEGGGALYDSWKFNMQHTNLCSAMQPVQALHTIRENLDNF